MKNIVQRDFVEKTEKSIDEILNIPVEKISFDTRVPVDNDITDSNKVYKGKVTILFADMRNSTKFTDENTAKTLVKVYRSFLKTITRAVRSCHGNIRDFVGDGVLAVFSDKVIDGQIVSSTDQAVMAGKTICTLIDYCLNPKLKNKFNVIIGYGIGICTGTVLATKVGMRGNEKNPDVENETGIIWIGSCTNYASKFCGCANSGEIVIDNNTYVEQSNKESWVPTQKIKGDTIYDCYVSEDNYLEIETNSNAVCIQTDIANNSVGLQISESITRRLDEYESKVQELALLSTELDKKQKKLNEKETALDKKEKDLKLIDNSLKEREALINETHYENLTKIIRNAHCRESYIVDCGEAFWDELLKQTIDSGKTIGKSELDIKIELCCVLANIYGHLKSWEKAYDYLCIQAEYCSWIYASTVEKFIVNSGHWVRIKDIIDARITKKVPLSLEVELKKCQEVFRKLGY